MAAIADSFRPVRRLSAMQVTNTMTMTTRALWASLLSFCEEDENRLMNLLTEVYGAMQQASLDESLTEWDAEAEALALRLLRPAEQFDSQDVTFGEWAWSGNEPIILGLS